MAGIEPISAALDIGGKLIDRLWPDPAERDRARLELLRMQQAGELAQISVNTEEARSASLFVSGWRPAVGWCCVAAHRADQQGSRHHSRVGAARVAGGAARRAGRNVSAAGSVCRHAGRPSD